jgi:hypothetical protein
LVTDRNHDIGLEWALLSFAVSSLVTYVLSGLSGSLSESAVQLSIAVMVASMIGTLGIRGGFVVRHARMIVNELHVSYSWPMLLVSLVSATVFARLLFFHSLYEHDNGALYSGGATWADMAIHLNIMHSFISGANASMQWLRWPQSPICAGARLVYAFMPDFHAAVLLRGGWSDRYALMIPSIVLGTSLCNLLLLLHQRLFRHTYTVAIIGVLLFVCSGGIGWYYWITAHSMSVDAIWDFVERISLDPQENLVWFATLPHVLLPQRGAIFGYPLLLIAMIALAALYTNVHTSTTNAHFRTMALSAFCVALLPLMQTHAFLSAFLFLAAFVLLQPKQLLQYKHFGGWVLFGLIVVVLSVPQCMCVCVCVCVCQCSDSLNNNHLLTRSVASTIHTHC